MGVSFCGNVKGEANEDFSQTSFSSLVIFHMPYGLTRGGPILPSLHAINFMNKKLKPNKQNKLNIYAEEFIYFCLEYPPTVKKFNFIDKISICIYVLFCGYEKVGIVY